MCTCVCVCVSPFEQYKEDLLVGTEIFNSRTPRADLPPEDVVKYLTHILLPLKTHTHTLKSAEPYNPILL